MIRLVNGVCVRVCVRACVRACAKSLLDDVSMNARIEQVSSEVKVEQPWLCVWLYVKDIIRGCECTCVSMFYFQCLND